MRDAPGGSGVAGATWALLVAAGAGTRLGIDRPKAFAELAGRPLLAESLDRLDRCPWVDAIVVAAPPGWEEPVILLSEELAASKVVACVTGGATRAESVRLALGEVADEALVVLVHDAARPLVEDAVVERVLGPLAEGYDGVVPALPVPDTLKRIEGRPRRRDRFPRRPRRGPDAAGVSRRLAAQGVRRGARGRDRLRVSRRASRRPRRGGGRRPASAQGHEHVGSRSRRGAAGVSLGRSARGAIVTEPPPLQCQAL